jgi:U4/U6 small nuclear ribonucleoprotein PRP31
VVEACEGLLHLVDCRKRLLEYVEARMSRVAPNLSNLVGSAISAKLIAAAGGLTPLARMPACTMQVLGKDPTQLHGLSVASTVRHVGLLYECDLVQRCPMALRKKAIRVVAAKATLAARCDGYGESNEGDQGRQLRDEIVKKIQKWQEPPPAKLPKPLPAPDEGKKKRRGGKRYRVQRERQALTELRKQQSRLAFGVAGGDDTDYDLGILGQGEAALGKVRIQAVDRKLTRKNARNAAIGGTSSTAGGASTLGGFKSTVRAIGAGSSGATSGLASTLAFTPVQGIELIDPKLQVKKVEEANHRYFSNLQFANVKKDGGK